MGWQYQAPKRKTSLLALFHLEQRFPRDHAMALWPRVQNRVIQDAGRLLFRKELTVKSGVPIVSFTFDDFPRSAFVEAGSILTRYGALGTYYVSLGLMGKPSASGPMYQAEDLREIAHIGHELGCHTFGHCHSWNTTPEVYERAILENRQALTDMLPDTSFQTFSYPFSGPRPAIKQVAGRHFLCCRGGGLKPGRYLFRHSGGAQTFNSGTTDLNQLCAFFLEKSRDDHAAVRSVIEQNARARGWLVFATHDVRSLPGPFGCTPGFFEQVVEWSLNSGARILPVVKALTFLRAPSRA
jgi:peptidoglycan/xylan/chitin deacetylase (PgdA/CDA1 family)